MKQILSAPVNEKKNSNLQQFATALDTCHQFSNNCY